MLKVYSFLIFLFLYFYLLHASFSGKIFLSIQISDIDWLRCKEESKTITMLALQNFIVIGKSLLDTI